MAKSGEELRALLAEKREQALLRRKRILENEEFSSMRTQSSVLGGYLVSTEKDHDIPRKRTAVEDDEPLDTSATNCVECGLEFTASLYRKQFRIALCDGCRKDNRDGKYSLITKSEAKEEYVLTDTDLDSSMGGLRCIERKNPRNERWGYMKLFLLCQVEDVCYKRYGGEEGLDAEIRRRAENKIVMQQKKQKNKVAKLRKETMTSLWKKPVVVHEHVFGPEAECKDKPGFWRKSCECGFEVEFETL
jgi:DNA-repair protein complementing XP-A cells